MSDSGKRLGKMLQEDGVASKLKQGFADVVNDNQRYVDFNNSGETIIDKNNIINKPLSLKIGDDDTINIAMEIAGPSTNEVFNVFGHGDANGIKFNDKILDANQVAYLIQNSPQYIGGKQKVVLYACETGSTSNGLAKQLAKKLGVNVVAPDALLFPTKTGGFEIADDMYRRGNWVEFDSK